MTLSMFLPVLTYPYATSSAGIQRALDFVATLGAEASASVMEIDIPPVTNPPIVLGLDVEAMAAAAEAQSRAQADEAVAQLRRESARMNVKLSIDRPRSRVEFAGDTLAIAARLHDYSVFPLGPSTDEKAVAEWLIFDSGRPVILIPSSGEAALHLETVAVAWDGGRVCARAFHDAMPLLENAARVVLLTADKDKEIDSESVQGATAQLDRRGIENSHLEVVVSGDKTIGDALQEVARRKDAGLLVMGGYGHGRFREFVLGGATRSVLKDLHLPVLMSH